MPLPAGYTLETQGPPAHSGLPKGYAPDVATSAKERHSALTQGPPPQGVLSYLGDIWNGVKGMIPHPPSNTDELMRESNQQGIAGGDAVDQASNSWVPWTKALRYTQAAGIPLVSGLAGTVANLQGPADAVMNGRIPSGAELHPMAQALPQLALGMATERTASSNPTYTGRAFTQEGEQLGSLPKHPDIANAPARVGPAANTAIRQFNPFGIPVGKTIDTLFPQMAKTPIVPEMIGGPSSPVPVGHTMYPEPAGPPAPNYNMYPEPAGPPRTAMFQKPAVNNPVGMKFAGQPSSPPIPANDAALQQYGAPAPFSEPSAGGVNAILQASPAAPTAAAMVQNSGLLPDGTKSMINFQPSGESTMLPWTEPRMTKPLNFGGDFDAYSNAMQQVGTPVAPTPSPTAGFTPQAMNWLNDMLLKKAGFNAPPEAAAPEGPPVSYPSTAEEIAAMGPDKMRKLMAQAQAESAASGESEDWVRQIMANAAKRGKK